MKSLPILILILIIGTILMILISLLAQNNGVIIHKDSTTMRILLSQTSIVNIGDVKFIKSNINTGESITYSSHD